MAGHTVAKKLGGRSQRLVLFLGLVLAAIAAVIVFAAVNGADSGGGSDNVPVVQAKEAIPADTRITSDMLEVKFVSADEADADAFTSRSQLIDRVVTEDVAAGAQVLTSDVSDVAGDGLTFRVEPGMRAISVGVQEVVTAGGNVKPGDHVDVVGIFSVPDAEAANHILQVLGLNYTVKEPPKPAPVATSEGENTEAGEDLVLTVTLLQNVKLLAMAQSLTETTAAGNVADELDEAETEPRASTATLELNPQQAQEITWVDNYGIVRMDARAVGDDQIVDVVPALLRIGNA